MQSWDEIRTAYFVAKMGTVSGAAEQLGFHHATVIRHVDALEEKLKTKLFQRHARGYTPTEAGLELLSVAQAAHDRFAQLEGVIKGQSDAVEGELVITSLVQLAPRLMPFIKEFRDMHPKVTLRYLADDRLFRLEYGEAHVAIRAGERAPDQPDNIVQHLADNHFALYGAASYVEKHGKPAHLDDLGGHKFVGNANQLSRAPFYLWMARAVDDAQVVFRTDDLRVAEAAVVEGVGLGFLPDGSERKMQGIQKVLEAEDVWASKLWLVTHMDLHRTAKVKAFTAFLKERLGKAGVP